MEDPEIPQTTLLNDQKKPLDSISHFENSKYFQMRALLSDLRPNFLEVLRTPDFRNCEAATEIRGKMKFLMDLYKEMTAETFTLEKCKTEQPTTTTTEQPSEELPAFVGGTTENQQGSYVVGGSAFGWNFITFPGTIAVYYGRTKEAFRAANVVSQPPN